MNYPFMGDASCCAQKKDCLERDEAGDNATQHLLKRSVRHMHRLFKTPISEIPPALSA